MAGGESRHTFLSMKDLRRLFGCSRAAGNGDDLLCVARNRRFCGNTLAVKNHGKDSCRHDAVSISRFHWQRTSSHLGVARSHEVIRSDRFDTWPDSFERIPKHRSRAAQPKLNHTGMRVAVETNDSSYVSIECDKKAIFTTAQFDEMRVACAGRNGKCLHDIVPLFSEPKYNWPIDIFIGKQAHDQAAEVR